MKNKIAIFFIFCSGTLFAQSFRCTIIDEDSKLPVPDVNVKVLNSPLATVSDQQGEFELSRFSGNQILILSAVGYGQIEININDTLRILGIKRSSIDLNNSVVITARRSEVSQFNVSEAVSVLGNGEFSKSSPRSVPEALTGTTGVWVQKTNHGGGSPVIRGLIGNQILLMVDGIRMNNATYRYGPNQYLSTIDPGLIERVEVTRGNGSVLYGSDAIGGVVQIISKTPHFNSGGNRFHGLINTRWMSAGMEQSIRGELQWNGKRVAAVGGLSVRNFGDIIAGGSLGKLSPTGYNEIAGDAKVLLRTGKNGVVTTAFQHHQQNDVPRYDQVQQGGYSFYNFEPQIRQLGYLRWEASTAIPFVNSIRITGALNHSTEGIESQKKESVEVRKQMDIVNTFCGIAEMHSIITRAWQAQSGVEWYGDKVQSSADLINISTNEHNSVRGSYSDGAVSESFALFSTHSFEINRLNIAAGFRFNSVALKIQDETFGNQRIHPDAWVGNIGLSYEIHKNYRLLANASSGFRAPNIDDVSKFGAVESTVFEIPSADLSSERSKTIEAGVKSSSENFSGSILFYYTSLYDLIERVPAEYQGADSIENRAVNKKQNISQSLLRGVEAESEIKISRQLSIHGNITYTHGENISRDEPMRRIPPAFSRISLRYAGKSKLWGRMEYFTAGEQSRLAKGDLGDSRISVRLRDGKMPGWNVLNLYAGYSYKLISFSVACQNAFDKSYRVYGSGIDGYGRTYAASLTAKF